MLGQRIATPTAGEGGGGGWSGEVRGGGGGGLSEHGTRGSTRVVASSEPSNISPSTNENEPPCVVRSKRIVSFTRPWCRCGVREHAVN